jgi:hypothetical protein
MERKAKSRPAIDHGSLCGYEVRIGKGYESSD